MTRGRTSLRLLRRAVVLAGLASPVYCQLTISPASLPDGTVNQTYDAGGISTNLSGPDAWTVISGALPPGLSLASTGNVSADVTGTPTAVGVYNFTVQSVDTGVFTAVVSATQFYSIRISAVLQVTTANLPQGTVGTPYSSALSATGGAPPYTWVLGTGDSGGSAGTAGYGRAGHAGIRLGRARTAAASIGLPPGVTLSTSGQLSGTPTVAGSYTFQATVNDSSSTDEQFATGTFTIVVSAQNPLLITYSSPLPGGTVGTRYSLALLAQGGNSPYSWALTAGALPPGITLASNGSMTGVPTQAGTYNFTVKVTDESGNTATGTFALVIAAGFSITTSSLAPGAVGVAYSAQINVTPTTAPYSFSVSSGALPPGLSLSASSTSAAGALSGTPTTAGNYTFTMMAADSAGNTASQGYTLVIGPAPITISPASPLPVGTLGTAYSQQLTATGGAGGYTFALGTGPLPGGLTLSSSGLLSGTPTAAGAFSIEISVTDSKQVTVTQQYLLTINPIIWD